MTIEERQELLDLDHLRLLRIGYLISGGVNAFAACIPLIHITLGTLMFLGRFPRPRNADGDLHFIGLFLVIMGSALSGGFAIFAVLKLVTARRLRERRSRTFCLVTAGLTCVELPYGTALGVFTIFVLQRPSVAAMFAD